MRAGADGLAHLFADSAPTPDFSQLVAEHHAFVVPTLTVLEGVSGRPSGESLASALTAAASASADSDIGELALNVRDWFQSWAANQFFVAAD